MACLGCRQKYKAALEAARAARGNGGTSTSVPRSSSKPWRRGVIRKNTMTPKVQPQPQDANVVAPPDCGPKDPSTGYLVSTIKEGTTEPGAPSIEKMNDISGGGGNG